MEFDVGALRELVDRFKDMHAGPPLEVMQAIVGLSAGGTIAGPLSVRDQVPVSEGSDQLKTTWECAALVRDSAVLTVSASRTGGDWYWEDFSEDTSAGTVYGDLIPLREVAAVRLLNVRSLGVTEWVSRWQLELRSRDSVLLPWPKHRHGQERHDSLARAVAERLR